MKEIFDTYIENAFDGYQQATFKIKQFENNYKKFFPTDKGARILDIGIGRGEMLTCLKRARYSNYLGVDISPSTVKFCDSLGLNCELIDDTVAWLDKNEDAFALITLLDVLEHIKKDEAIPFLKALRGALRDRGTLIVQVPNMQSPDSQLHRYNDITHEIGFIENSLKQVLMTAGFTSIEFFGFEDFIFEHWSRYYWLAVRKLYWKYVRFIRKVTGNLNPEILNPVFFAKVTK
jgi:2-polyprenyl-3-methyl-5-hydroxy-6-metoxy-1,4-benzoquinol methylase